MKIISVMGARPNFFKIAPFIGAIERQNADGVVKVGNTERCLEAIIKAT